MILPYAVLRPLIFCFDAETAHGLSIQALKMGLAGTAAPVDDPVLRSMLWGLDFPTPVGLAAGFDKNAEVGDAVLAQGFGFVEVGTITPRPQPGNPKPRMFRLTKDRAVINRLGFNNQGLDVMTSRLRARLADGTARGVLGANVGANKDSADPAADYVTGIRALADYADYITINISSPNTPGLRSLQRRDALDHLLGAAMAARADAQAHSKAGAVGARRTNVGKPIPILVKIAPDLTTEEREDIAAVVIKHNVDGLIVSNTTISRPEILTDAQRTETGGLSGAPLLGLATSVLQDMYRLTKGTLPLVGVGGIACGADAYAKIRAGASLVQLYSAMVYEGPRLGRTVAVELAALLKADGFKSVTEAVGVDVKGV